MVSTPVTRLPLGLVSRRLTNVSVCRVTLPAARAGFTPQLSESPFASKIHGNASHVPQNMHLPPVCRSIPIGRENGCRPFLVSLLRRSAIYGSVGTGGCGKGEERGP